MIVAVVSAAVWARRTDVFDQNPRIESPKKEVTF